MAHKSIFQDEKECYVCHTTFELHLHHVFYGMANRKKSDKWGCVCYLCGRHHNLSNEGVHFNKRLDERLKKTCQQAFEDLYGHDKFMEIFGRNYL